MHAFDLLLEVQGEVQERLLFLFPHMVHYHIPLQSPENQLIVVAVHLQTGNVLNTVVQKVTAALVELNGVFGEHVGLGVGDDWGIGLENVSGEGSVQSSVQLAGVELVGHGRLGSLQLGTELGLEIRV